MARLGDRDCGYPLGTRGAVYVEFLFAFLPLFVLFLAVCQLALLASARLVVQHAALTAARSAVVVLEEPPEEYGDAPLGTLSHGRPRAEHGAEALLAALDLQAPEAPLAGAQGVLGSVMEVAGGASQQGARMAPIRTAAYLPLLILAPNERSVAATGAESLGGSLPGDLSQRLPFAVAFARAGSVVTVHARAGADELANEPIGPTAPVTVRVTFLYACGVPIVRSLMCRTLAALLEPGRSEVAERMKLAESPSHLLQLVAAGARFVALTAEATLPNQGAAYYR